MIGWIAKALGLDKLLVWGATILIATGLVWWAASTVYGNIYDSGYSAASARYQAEIAADRTARLEADLNEQRRQIIANNAAKKREAEAIAALEAEEAQNQELRRESRREAEQDPDAGRIAISPGGVQRLNKIR